MEMDSAGGAALEEKTYPLDESTLTYARELIAAQEAGDGDKALECIGKLASLHESALFQELGKLTREFHDALNSFYYDDRINQLAEDDIPDAKQRLNFVIEKTDNAAHRTLTAVENSIPVCDTMGTAAAKLLDAWVRFTRRELSPQEFRDLAKELQAFLKDTDVQSEEIKGNLNEVLMAQDFQDITGQIIKRVIKLVDEVEKSLVSLVRLGGGLGLSNNAGSAADRKKEEELAGPAVPGLDNDVVSGQDDVDELLSSLGF